MPLRFVPHGLRASVDHKGAANRRGLSLRGNFVSADSNVAYELAGARPGHHAPAQKL